MISEDVVIVIPTYNCKEQSFRVIEKIEKINALKNIPKIIIDNDSSDQGYLSAIEQLKKVNATRWKVYKNTENYGLGGTFKVAYSILANSNFQHMIWLHGDDQVKIEEINDILEHKNNYDAIFGSRFLDTSKLSNYSKVRKTGNILLNRIISLLINKKITELGSGLNIFKINSLPELEIETWPDHIAFDMKLLLHFHKSNYRVCEVPISWSSTDQESNANNIITGIQIILMTLTHVLKLNRYNRVKKTLYKYEQLYEC